MQKMSGLELQDALTTQGYSIPIIFITAFPNASAEARALKAGAVGFLNKPFESRTLINFLEVALKDRSWKG
jgi:FixJ family two-component response regulator